MPQPPTINDVPAGQVVKIGSQLVTFPSEPTGPLVCEEIMFTKEMRSADFTNDLGQDARAVYSTKKGTGTLVAQFRTAGAIIGAGELFTILYQNFVTIPCIVISVGNVFTQNGAAKIPITFAEYLDASVLPKSRVFDGAVGNSFATTPHQVKAHNVPGSNQQCFIVKQRFSQLATSWVSTALGALGPVIEGQQTYLVDELEPEDVGVAGMQVRDVVWASKPSQWQQSVSVAKNFQRALYTWNGSNQLTGQGLGGYTQTIKATATYDYYIDSASVGSLPTVPTLSLVNLFGFQQLDDGGTGFPITQYPFGTGYANNYGISFITGSVEPYIGKMMVRKLIYG